MTAPRTGLACLVLVLACNGGPSDATAGASTTSTSTDPGTSTSGTTSTDPTTGSTTSSGSDSATTTSSTSTGEPATTTTTSTSTTTTTSGGPLRECPQVADPVEIAIVDDPDLGEASGLIASRTQPDVFWLHNDSGDDPRFFAIDSQGQRLGVFNVVDAIAIDWEDMSSGPGPSPGEFLYFGDIGDNTETRQVITVYRVPEPDAASAGGGEVDVAGVEVIELTYPDEPHNAETMFVDPQTADLVIVAKGDPTRVFRLPGPVAAGGPYMLEEVAPIDFPAVVTTGGDISPAGDFIAVRTYIEALLWLRPPGATIADAFASEPCSIPLAQELQGEALTIASDGSGYYTISEGSGAPLYWYAFE